jgi:hypothetical protein
MHAIFPYILTILEFIVWIIFSEEHKLWSSRLYNLLHPPVTSSILHPNNPLGTQSSNNLPRYGKCRSYNTFGNRDLGMYTYWEQWCTIRKPFPVWACIFILSKLFDSLPLLFDYLAFHRKGHIILRCSPHHTLLGCSVSDSNTEENKWLYSVQQDH